ncbi:MAG: hypothetical protein J7K21_00530 [Desulfurococcales archaeon]|nr:hypothetical protein [Desulfurococcales archaeon]
MEKWRLLDIEFLIVLLLTFAVMVYSIFIERNNVLLLVSAILFFLETRLFLWKEELETREKYG